MKLEISKEELKDYPIKGFEGKVHYTKTEEEFDAIWFDFIEGIDTFGIDTETKPAFKKGQSFPTSLLQICNGEEVLVHRLQNGILNKDLIAFLEDEDLLKVGIAIKDDMKELRRDNPSLKDKEVLDLSEMARQLGFISFGAKRLTALLLGFTVSKGQRTSDWSAPELSEAQLRYASTDAWICNLIFDKLEKIESNGF